MVPYHSFLYHILTAQQPVFSLGMIEDQQKVRKFYVNRLKSLFYGKKIFARAGVIKKK